MHYLAVRSWVWVEDPNPMVSEHHSVFNLSIGQNLRGGGGQKLYIMKLPNNGNAPLANLKKVNSQRNTRPATMMRYLYLVVLKM